MKAGVKKYVAVILAAIMVVTSAPYSLYFAYDETESSSVQTTAEVEGQTGSGSEAQPDETASEPEDEQQNPPATGPELEGVEIDTAEEQEEALNLTGLQLGAAPTGNANNAALDAIMNLSSPLSGNGTTYNEYTSSKSVPGTWIDYLNAEWMQCRNDFSWTDTSALGIPLWDGQTCGTTEAPNAIAPSLPGNEAMRPYFNGAEYEIWTGQQLRYAFTRLNTSSTQTIKLMRDIDLNGSNVNWGRVTPSYVSLVLDGNGKTIYNLGLKTSLFLDRLVNSTIKNLTFKSVKSASTGSHSVSIFLQFSACNVYNVKIESSLFYNDCAATNQYTAPLVTMFDINYVTTLDNCSVRNTDVYGVNHVGGFVSIPGNAVITNCFAIDGTVISTGGHSGGFISCNDYVCHVRNCFTNNDVYGAGQTGGFEGYSASTEYVNCYSSGTVEGFETLGGFLALVKSRFEDEGYSNFTNCYSTAIVGMENGGTKTGGFLGETRNGDTAPYYPTYPVFTNCYAAGEVGSLDTDVSAGRNTFKDVGGFFGVASGTGTNTYRNCYYDRQTTAMREWASGTSQSVSGITGVFTADAYKNGIMSSGLTSAAGVNGFTGFTAAQTGQWVITNDGLYPQVAVFVNPSTFTAENRNVVIAFSRASVSTVHLSTWEKDYEGDYLPETVYDTVRDLTVRFPLTSGAATTWHKGGAKTQIFGTMQDVLSLSQFEGTWHADDFVPGVEWLEVNVTVDGAVGSRWLRIIPTANLIAGNFQKIYDTQLYDHADDVAMVYSTAQRMARSANRDITQGVFPDVPLNGAQQAIQGSAPAEFAGADDSFTGVYTGHVAPGSSMEVEVFNVLSIDEATGKVITGDELPLRQGPNTLLKSKWNGHAPFNSSDEGYYLVKYFWNLADGRFISNVKVVQVIPRPKLTINVINDDVGRTPNSTEVKIQAKEKVDALSLSVKSADEITMEYMQPATAAFQVLRPYVTTIVAIEIEREGVTPYKETLAMPATGDFAGQTFTIPYHYFKQAVNEAGDTYISETTVQKTYKILKDSNGVYRIEFDRTSGYVDGTEYSDLENSIKLTLVVRSQPSVLHVRQVVVNRTSSEIPLPKNGYLTLANMAAGGAVSAQISAICASGQNNTPYTDFVFGYTMPIDNEFEITPVIPQYYRYVGNCVSYTDGQADFAQAESGIIKTDFGTGRDIWVTIYIEPEASKGAFFAWDDVLNNFGYIGKPPIAE